MIIFLDYDDVVNSPMWRWDEEKNKFRCNYNFPRDNEVNNRQAVQWISELCQKFDADIVVTSTWRRHKNYKECLINAGLRPGIKILGRIDIDSYVYRYELIERYIYEHNISPYDFLVIDDDEYAWQDNAEDGLSRFVKVTSHSFGITEYFEAEEKIRKLKNFGQLVVNEKTEK